MNQRILFTGLLLGSAVLANAQMASDTTQMLKDRTLDNVTVSSHVTKRRVSGAINATSLLRDELFKAACCNLGESFVNNPSVDVNYSDAATGARQIKLLGLSGTYVQMLTENLPNFRGAAMPYGLGYVPGSWMRSIQVSTGNSSVKNGYEAMTGQVNVEYLKPEDDQGLTVNLYGNTMQRFEANADGNIHINGNKDLSTEILAHFENNWSHHDGNSDGFQDDPQVRQYNLQNRWMWKTGHYMFHGGVSLLSEDRSSGQTAHHGGGLGLDTNGLFKIGTHTNRYEAYMKHAYLFGDEHNSNIALMGSVSMHEQDATYGRKWYDVNEKNAYASLMYETNITPEHNLSVGLSLNHDFLHQDYALTPSASAGERLIESETTPGAYAQYTYNLNNKLIAMAGLRIDHSNVFGTFVTPRFHLKWVANDIITLRASAGKGYRSPHALAETNYLMASGRQLVIDKLDQENAWNYGLAANLYIPVGNKTLKLNTEYYYTRFGNQMVIDYDTDPKVLHIGNLAGRSYSHVFQVDANYQLFKDFDVTAAYRYNLVKTTYGDRLLWKPLQSRYKALLSIDYRPAPGLWQFDVTFALNGGGRMPDPARLDDGSEAWNRTFAAYPMLNAQVKRNFRHFEVYVGGENLTNFKQKNPIIGSHDPWGDSFEPTMVYGPIRGAMGYVGIRFNLGHHL